MYCAVCLKKNPTTFIKGFKQVGNDGNGKFGA